MAHHPVSDGSKAASSTTGESGEQPDELQGPSDVEKTESNLTELAARFVTKSGGGLSPQLSADLALEIVLNEIVEQACLATGATGAAIVLKDEGEMVCRASSGDTSPALGTRFDNATGLSHLCIETSRVQRCDDAQADPRAEAEACRRLGVRSVMALPLLKDAEVVGLFEVFSSLSSAFGDRDEHTLEALSRRVLKNLELAAEPLPEPVEVSRIVHPLVGDDSQPDADADDPLHYPSFAPSSPPLLVEETRETASGYGLDFVTGVLGAAVLAGAVLLAVLIGQRLGGRNARRDSVPDRGQVAGSVSTDARGVKTRIADGMPSASAQAQTGAASIRKGGPGRQPGASSPSSDPSLSEGGLQVYENGKEIFRMSADGRTAESPGNTNGGGVRRASAIEPARVLELSPSTAEGSLLHRVEPEYPEEARQQQIQGLVVLDVRISRDGSVQSVNLVRGQSLLADSAIAAVKLWRFNPRTLNGQPTEMQTTVTLNFRLPPDPKM